MKRTIILSLTALGLLLAMQQEASAWSKFKFGIGFNISWEGANNSFLFGLLKGGPAPANVDGGYTDGAFPQGGPAPYSPGLSPEGFGSAPPPAPGPTFGQPVMAQPVSYSAYSQMGAYNPNGYYQGGAYAQPYNNQQMGGYQASYYGQGAYQAPSYWYGR